MAGRNIRCSTDKLQKVKLEYLYHSIRNPKPEIATMLRLLRTIKDIDGVRYTTVKKQLPYFTCATFAPPYLSIENFAYIEQFIVDVENLSEKGIDLEELKLHLAQDRRVLLMFASPGRNGLKVMFGLKECCYDYGMFNVFFNLFQKDFYEKHNLDFDISSIGAGVMDAYFISVDEQVYYNPNAEGVDMNEYIEEDNPAVLIDSLRELKHIAKENKRGKETKPKNRVDLDPNPETMLHIKEVLLGIESVEHDKKTVSDSGVLDEVVSGLADFTRNQGIDVVSVKKMQNARKLQFALGDRRAEVNIFKGNKGFFAVQSPVGSNSKEFGKVVIEITNAYLSNK